MPPQAQTETVASGVFVPFIGDGVVPPMPRPPPPPRQPAAALEPSNADMASMSPHQLKHYLVTLIAREWKKSATCLSRPAQAVAAATAADLMVLADDRELAVCDVKFRCDDVPAGVVAKVQYLFDRSEQAKKENGGQEERIRAQGWGAAGLADCFFGVDKFMALLRNEVRMVTFEDDVDSPRIDRYQGVSGALAMLAELAIFRIQLDTNYALDTEISPKISFKVAIVCGIGHTYTYAFSAQLDAKFDTVAQELNRRFPRLCDPRCPDMIGRWQEHIKDLKQTGMGEHPKLAVVERLIREHAEAPHEMSGEWMYVHELSAVGDRLRGEKEFAALMQWAAGSADHQPKGCLMRVMEAKMREIFAALKMMNEEQDRIMDALKSQSKRSPKRSPEEEEPVDEKETVIGTLQNDEGGSMPWDTDDLETEGTGSSTEKEEVERAAPWDQHDGTDTSETSV